MSHTFVNKRQFSEVILFILNFILRLNHADISDSYFFYQSVFYIRSNCVFYIRSSCFCGNLFRVSVTHVNITTVPMTLKKLYSKLYIKNG